jgi:hypothetical protein
VKRVALLILAVLLTILPVSAFAAKTLTGYTDVETHKPDANYTVRYLHQDGTGGYRTYNIYVQEGDTVDQAIRKTLTYKRSANETDIYAITHVNGVPIEQTAYAQYGGKINHKGGPDNPVVNLNIALYQEVYVSISDEIVEFPDQQAVVVYNRTCSPACCF